MRKLATFYIAALVIVIAPSVTQAKQPPGPMNWTGAYGGFSVGGRWAGNDWNTTDVAPTLAAILSNDPNPNGQFDSMAARIGAYLGYNWLIAPLWIAGIEADIGWANNKKNFAPIPGTVQNDIVAIFSYINQPHGSVSENWDASVRGRLGRLIAPDLLLFGTLGVSWQSVELTAQCPASGGATDWCTIPNNESHSAVRTGWTVGGGIERMIGRWIVRAEYRYADFGTLSHTFFTFNTAAVFDDRFTAHVAVRTQTAAIGVAYKFSGD